jgi:hypothetical protein
MGCLMFNGCIVLQVIDHFNESHIFDHKSEDDLQGSNNLEGSMKRRFNET